MTDLRRDDPVMRNRNRAIFAYNDFLRIDMGRLYNIPSLDNQLVNRYLTNLCQSVPAIYHRILIFLVPLNLKRKPSSSRLLIWVLVIRAISISAPEIHAEAKHAWRPMVFIATPAVSAIETSQDISEPRVPHLDHRVVPESVDHGLDQGRRLGVRISVVVSDDCISILPDSQRSWKRLRSKPEGVRVLDRAISGDA